MGPDDEYRINIDGRANYLAEGLQGAIKKQSIIL